MSLFIFAYIFSITVSKANESFSFEGAYSNPVNYTVGVVLEASTPYY